MTRPRGYKVFFMVNSNVHEILTSHKKTNMYAKYKAFVALKLSDVVFILLTNVKMATFVDILTFVSRINFILS